MFQISETKKHRILGFLKFTTNFSATKQLKGNKTKEST